MRVLVTGAGQLGSAFTELARKHGHQVTLLSHLDFDLTDPGQFLQAAAGHNPQLILHTAALTKVNYCEEHPVEATEANGTATGLIDEVAAANNAQLVYFSTDYVFPGETAEPILEDAQPRPLNVYGQTKWAGEMHVAKYTRGHIIRTSGVFGPRADGTERNFFRAIYEKLTAGPDPIEVVDDQFTCVTYAPHLAAMVLELLPDLPRITHLTSAGGNSWHGWAVELAHAAGFDPARIVPVPTDPGSPVRRPAYSVLGSRYERVNNLIGQYPATNGIAEYAALLRDRK